MALSKPYKNENKSPLVLIKDLVADDLNKVDILIESLAENKLELIGDVSLHTFRSGGKRLRPILTLASAKLFNYQGDAHISLATAVEFIHTATLLHDDVVDHSDVRRGTPTANTLWGNKESILVGDFLFAKSFELMGNAQSLEIFRALSSASVVISEGEVLQLSSVGKLENSRERYFDVVRAKTAELFASACYVGGVLGEAKQEQQKALHNYGLCLGIAFQIIDDLLDYSASVEEMGKCVGDDFKECKMTLPVIIAYENAQSDDEKSFWQRVIGDGKQNDDDFAQAIEYMKLHDVNSKSLETAREYAEDARKSLDLLPNTEITSQLNDLLSFVVERSY